MKFLGVDPGSRHCGWGVVERRGSRLAALAWGRISPSPERPLAERLSVIATQLAQVIAEHAPERAAVECVFHGPSARSLIVLAEARGVVLAELARSGLEVAEFAPAEVKSAVTGSGRADKGQVARMVALELGLPAGRIAADATDALAVALAQAHREGLQNRLPGGR